MTALWTPGHFGNHLCFEVGDTVLSGDLVMGWASSLVSPPDGDLTQFMASCIRLRERLPGALLPGHGAPVTEPAARLDWLLAHRRMREAEILAALADGAQTAATLSARIYTDTPPPPFLPAASRNVLAHLIDLTCKSLARPLGTLDADTAFESVATRTREFVKFLSQTLWTSPDRIAIRALVFRRSSAVEQLTVNQLVVGSIPTAGDGLRWQPASPTISSD